MLEKNKDYIEFKAAHSCADYRQFEMTQLEITGYSNSDLATPLPNPGTDYILISKEKFEALQTENEQLKKKLEEFLTALYPENDVERLVWATEQICCGQVSVNGWMASAKFWKKRYDDIFKLVGFSSKEEVEDYLVNEAKCDTLHEAISKLHDEVEWIGDELASANSKNNSWKATAECNSPKTLRTKLTLLRGNIEEWKEETGIYKRALKEWKEATGCSTPEEAKDLIDSGASWHHAYNQFKVTNKKLSDDVKSWRNATGYSTPEGFLSAMLNTPDNVDTRLWRDATGCSTPEEARDWVNVTGCSCPKDLSKKIVEWEKVFTPHMSARDLCSAMSNAIESYKHKFAPWEEITGFSTPEKCSSYIDILEKKLEDIKDLIEED